MELELYRIDYTIVGVTASNCMKLLPSSFKEPQKIAIGDNDGILQVFSIKKEDIQIQFKTLPGSKISSLQLAGARGSPADKIFIASENEVRGYTKKGKLFLSFDTNLTEAITAILQSFKRWIIGNKKYSSGISCIESHDLTGDSIKNIIIGRNDGNLEIYSASITDEIDEPVIIFIDNCNESITAIQCGIISNSNQEEVIVSTYTGRIIGWTTEATTTQFITDNSSANHAYASDTSQKIIKLKNELEDLQAKVAKERDKYQVLTQSLFDEMSRIPVLNIKHSMILNKTAAAYTLTLEVPTAIDNVLLQSNVPVDLLDVEKNSAVVSYSEQDPKNGNFLLATYRCQINTNRLEVKIRTIEGQHGILQAYITPLTQPKFCQLKIHEIKPLSLHLRIHNFDQSRPYNSLTVKGQFSLAEIHSWVYQCLPEVPEKPQVTEKTELYFQSSFLDTILFCSYWKGEAEFKSDNVSTISTLKDFISKEATKKKIKIDVSTNIIDESITHVLKIIDPKLKSHTELSNKITLLDALHELEVNDASSMSCLSSKYKELLENEKELRLEFTSQPSYLDRLYGIITDLYVDFYKLKGTNVKSKIPKLIHILDNYSYEDLLQQFRPDS
ncbi:bardet-biedl syndrome 7 protein [Holotrichia oblita]|uniref:Bardet-biedl syndrome 7 protein n=1 Tax=Holotrichia oblita TaxID=644536 RepID=A0ACB9T7H0_HOLOL|nr:bardet-biedl syndrome 7 protein [Holotrichia oblita]